MLVNYVKCFWKVKKYITCKSTIIKCKSNIVNHTKQSHIAGVFYVCTLVYTRTHTHICMCVYMGTLSNYYASPLLSDDLWVILQIEISMSEIWHDANLHVQSKFQFSCKYLFTWNQKSVTFWSNDPSTLCLKLQVSFPPRFLPSYHEKLKT